MELNRFAVSWTTETITERRKYSTGFDGEDDIGNTRGSGKKERDDAKKPQAIENIEHAGV
jgi:hypothetical protein